MISVRLQDARAGRPHFLQFDTKSEEWSDEDGDDGGGGSGVGCRK